MWGIHTLWLTAQVQLHGKFTLMCLVKSPIYGFRISTGNYALVMPLSDLHVLRYKGKMVLGQANGNREKSNGYSFVSQPLFGINGQELNSSTRIQFFSFLFDLFLPEIFFFFLQITVIIRKTQEMGIFYHLPGLQLCCYSFLKAFDLAPFPEGNQPKST